MDWVTIFVELSRATAWPVAAVVIALVYKKPLISLFPRLKNIRFKDLEIKLEKSMRDAERVAETVKLPPPSQPPPAPNREVERPGDMKTVESRAFPDSTKVYIEAMAEGSPRAAIERGWEEVVAATWAVCLKHRVSVSEKHPPSSAPAEALRAQGLMDESLLSLYGRLSTFRHLANATPGFEPSTVLAKRFLELAIRLWERIKQL